MALLTFSACYPEATEQLATNIQKRFGTALSVRHYEVENYFAVDLEYPANTVTQEQVDACYKWGSEKERCNSTSILVSNEYRGLIEQIIAIQNQTIALDGLPVEFIAEIELEFEDTLLVTTNYETFKNTARDLFDDTTLLAFMLDINFPIVDDDWIIKQHSETPVWFCNNYI